MPRKEPGANIVETGLRGSPVQAVSQAPVMAARGCVHSYKTSACTAADGVGDRGQQGRQRMPSCSKRARPACEHLQNERTPPWPSARHETYLSR
jgi:hypothetical protein